MIKWVNSKIDSFSEYIYNRSDNNGQSLESVKLNYRALFYTLIFVAGASIVYTPIAMSNMAEAEAERLELAEQERLAKIEEEEQARLEAEKQKREEEEQRLADQKEAEKLAEIERQRFLDTFGISKTDFTETCLNLITSESGSSNFGVFNASNILEYPSVGSLVLQRSVHGKNAFGANVEQRYKCWSERTGKVSIELINVNFN